MITEQIREIEWNEKCIREKIEDFEKYIHHPLLTEGMIVNELNLDIMDELAIERLEELGGLKERQYKEKWPICTFEYNNGNMYQGQWRYQKYHGYGVELVKGENIVEAEWKDG